MPLTFRRHHRRPHTPPTTLALAMTTDWLLVFLYSSSLHRHTARASHFCFERTVLTTVIVRIAMHWIASDNAPSRLSLCCRLFALHALQAAAAAANSAPPQSRSRRQPVVQSLVSMRPHASRTQSRNPCSAETPPLWRAALPFSGIHYPNPTSR